VLPVGNPDQNPEAQLRHREPALEHRPSRSEIVPQAWPRQSPARSG
jgi:hypothetical protein